MDSLTQITLGGAVGEAVLGKKVGNKAILWGAIAGYIPDIDFAIGSLCMETVDGLAFHRGVMHSVLFCLVAAPILGWLVNYLYRKKPESDWWGWTQLFFLSLVTHPLLDCFTTWGTQFFWPSDFRVSLSSIFIVDPAYTLPMLVSLIWLMFKKRTSSTRKKLRWFALTFSTIYLFATYANKSYVDTIFESELKRQEIPYLRYFSKPTPLNQILWNVTAETKDAYYLAYYSHFDKSKRLTFSSISKNLHLLGNLANNEHVQYLINTIDGYYSIEKKPDRLIVHDLRFGP